MESSPIERAVQALESIAQNLYMIQEALYANRENDDYGIANIVDEQLQGIAREISGK